jgi:cytoskeleton protein RodZ
VLKAGETYRVPGRSGLVLRTGNAGALAIIVDGKQVPAIGPPGALRRNVALDPEALIGGTAVQG